MDVKYGFPCANRVSKAKLCEWYLFLTERIYSLIYYLKRYFQEVIHERYCVVQVFAPGFLAKVTISDLSQSWGIIPEFYTFVYHSQSLYILFIKQLQNFCFTVVRAYCFALFYSLFAISTSSTIMSCQVSLFIWEGLHRFYSSIALHSFPTSFWFLSYLWQLLLPFHKFFFYSVFQSFPWFSGES